MQKKFNAVLFDLDGTLIDTAPDLASALNHVLRRENKKPLPLSDIRHVSSDGTQGLLKLGFQIDPTHSDYERLRHNLLDYYHAHISEYSSLFNGIKEILDKCDQKKLPWGIVTNKPAYLTDKLLKKLNLDKRTKCVISGDTLSKRKPHPEPLLYAAKLLHTPPDMCCYVGDAEGDVQAARSAHMFVITALYGYIHHTADPYAWQADSYIQSPDELNHWIDDERIFL